MTPNWGVYAEGVRLIALRALGDPAQAADVAQEAITRAIASLADGRPDPIRDVGGFVYGIARHIIADLHRSQSRNVPIDETPEVPTAHPDALESAIAEEDRQRVRSALQELPASDRDLLHDFFVDGLTADVIAARLGETPVNIRKRKSRALERLRRVFGGHGKRSGATGE